MNYIPSDKRERVQSLLRECEENIGLVLSESIVVELSIRPKKEYDDDMVQKTIIDHVTEFYNTNLAEMQGKSRVRNITDARQLYGYLMKQYTKMPDGEITQMINRDRTCMHNYISNVNNFISIKDEVVMNCIGGIIPKMNHLYALD